MAERLVVHLGPPKTGSTYLQAVLWSDRERLRGHGVLVPGRGPFEHNLLATAVREGDAAGPRPRRVAERLARRVGDHPGTAVLSCEWFAYADPGAASRLLDLVPAARTDVVVTARDLAAFAPAAWQERLKLGHATGLDDFVASLDAPGGRWSWSTLDPAEVLDRWAPAVGADRCHVVTVPPSRAEPGELWRRFADAAGLDPAVADPGVQAANESLSVVSARLLQEVGPRLRAAVDADAAHWEEQYRWLRRLVGHRLLVPRRGEPIALAPADHDRVRRRGARTRERLAAAAYPVHGDLADLVPPGPRPGTHPDDVATEDLLAAAGDLAADLLRELRDRDREHQRARSDGPTDGPTDPHPQEEQ